MKTKIFCVTLLFLIFVSLSVKGEEHLLPLPYKWDYNTPGYQIVSGYSWPASMHDCVIVAAFFTIEDISWNITHIYPEQLVDGGVPLTNDGWVLIYPNVNNAPGAPLHNITTVDNMCGNYNYTCTFTLPYPVHLVTGSYWITWATAVGTNYWNGSLTSNFTSLQGWVGALKGHPIYYPKASEVWAPIVGKSPRFKMGGTRVKHVFPTTTTSSTTTTTTTSFTSTTTGGSGSCNCCSLC